MPMPDEMKEEEEDPSNKAVPAAIAVLGTEIAQIKSDLCTTIDSHFKNVYTDLKEEITTAKRDLQTSISKPETTSTSLG